MSKAGFSDKQKGKIDSAIISFQSGSITEDIAISRIVNVLADRKTISRERLDYLEKSVEGIDFEDPNFCKKFMRVIKTRLRYRHAI